MLALKTPYSSKRIKQVKAMGRQLSECAACFQYYHLFREDVGAGSSARWETWDRARLGARFARHTTTLAARGWEHTSEGRGLVNGLLEVLNFPLLLDDEGLREVFCTALSAVNALAAADPEAFHEVLPWDQGHKLAGVFTLMALKDAELRAWATDTVTCRMSSVTSSDYENEGIGEVLRGWAVSASMVNFEASAGMEPGDESFYAWAALTTSITRLDPGALESLAGHCPALLECLFSQFQAGPSPASIASFHFDMKVAAARALQKYFDAFHGRVWHMAPEETTNPSEIMQGITWHLSNNGSTSGAEHLVMLVDVLLESVDDVEWYALRDDYGSVANGLATRTIVRPSLGSNIQQRDPSVKKAVTRFLAEEAILVCIQAGESARCLIEGCNNEVSTGPVRVYHVAVQTMCHLLNKYHYDHDPTDAVADHFSRAARTSSQTQNLAKRRWNISNTSEVPPHDEELPHPWWPLRDANRWSALLLHAMCRRETGSGDAQAATLLEGTHESVDMTIRRILCWHGTLVKLLAGHSARAATDETLPFSKKPRVEPTVKKCATTMDFERALCGPLINEIANAPIPFSIPICVHAYMFHSETLLAQVPLSASEGHHRARFEIYLKRLVAACQASPQNAAGRLLEYTADDDLPAPENDEFHIKAVLRSATALVLVGESPEAPGADSEFLLSPSAQSILSLIRTDSQKCTGSMELDTLRVLVEPGAALAYAATTGEDSRMTAAWNGFADAVSCVLSVQHVASAQFYRRTLNFMLHLAKLKATIMPSKGDPDELERRKACQSIWSFFESAICGSIFSAEPILLLKVFKAFYKELVTVNPDSMLGGSLLRWGAALLPFIEWNPPSVGIHPAPSAKDVISVRKWSGVLLANAVASSQQSGHLLGGTVTGPALIPGQNHRSTGPGLGVTALMAGCQRLMERTDPPLDPQLKEVLTVVLQQIRQGADGRSVAGGGASPTARPHTTTIAPATQHSSIAKLWQRKGLTTEQAIVVGETPPKSPPVDTSRERHPFVLRRVNPAASALDALIEAEDDDAALTASHPSKKRPAFTLSSSSSSVGCTSSYQPQHTHQADPQPMGMNMYSEGELVKVKPHSEQEFDGVFCKGCGDGLAEGDFAVVRTRNPSGQLYHRPFVRHLACVAPPAPSLQNVREFIRAHCGPSGPHMKVVLDKTDLYVRQRQVPVRVLALCTLLEICLPFLTHHCPTTRCF